MLAGLFAIAGILSIYTVAIARHNYSATTAANLDYSARVKAYRKRKSQRVYS